MTKLQRKRLFRLANHLEKGKLFHKKFDFSHLCEITRDSQNNLCGAAGCAIGELPAVFPKLWRFKLLRLVDAYDVQLRRRSQGNAFLDLESFFGISHEVADHLFHPSRQDITRYGGEWLENDASAKQVASNIREFLKITKGSP